MCKITDLERERRRVRFVQSVKKYWSSILFFLSLSNLIQIVSWGSAGKSVCCSTKQRGKQEQCGASLAVHFLQTHTHATYICKR